MQFLLQTDPPSWAHAINTWGLPTVGLVALLWSVKELAKWLKPLVEGLFKAAVEFITDTRKLLVDSGQVQRDQARSLEKISEDTAAGRAENAAMMRAMLDNTTAVRDLAQRWERATLETRSRVGGNT